MSQYEVDVFIYCDNPDCEHSPEEPTCLNGSDGEIHHWTCPECKKEWEFEIEFDPTVSGFREKQD